ncbi:MAG TPA: DoxX family protein [Acidobacteriaceae bacterium]|nr:DoxX family protein [Acidobacteriaceae bacterium]
MGSILNSGVVRAHGHFTRGCKWLESPLLLAVRLIWGWQFTLTGWGKLRHLDHVTGFFASLGIPLPGLMAPAISFLEFAGGILLIVGLLTRLTGFLLAADMIVAYLVSDLDALRTLFSNDPSKFWSADPFTFLMASLIALVFGAGAYSLDRLIQNKIQRRSISHDSVPQT